MSHNGKWSPNFWYLDPAWCLVTHLVVDPEHVHDVDANVDDVDGARVWEVELVVVPGQAQVVPARLLGVADHLG